MGGKSQLQVAIGVSETALLGALIPIFSVTGVDRPCSEKIFLSSFPLMWSHRMGESSPG
jgi:hypothetical protein